MSATSTVMADFVRSECADDGREWRLYCSAVARLRGCTYEELQDGDAFDIVHDYFSSANTAAECAEALDAELRRYSK